MSCYARGVSPANLPDADKLQHAAIERAQLSVLETIVNRLAQIDVPTIRKDALNDLSIALSPELNVDDSGSPLEASDTFFAPCDWPLDVLKRETRQEQRHWRNVELITLELKYPLQVSGMRQVWLRRCLMALARLVPDLWHVPIGVGSIVRWLDLHLPMRQFYSRSSPSPATGAPVPHHTAYVKWAMVAPEESGLPHASCFMLDSGTPEENTILLSEVGAAAVPAKHQPQSGLYTGHHTKPVLVATVLRNETGRLTQVRFDAKLNKLLLRQSRALDLSGAQPGDDAWTMLRWIASRPVGDTRYAAGEAGENVVGDDPAHHPPWIPV